MHPYRTHHCNQLTAANVGESVKLSGWVHRKRDHGQLLFVDLRDHFVRQPAEAAADIVAPSEGDNAPLEKSA